MLGIIKDIRKICPGISEKAMEEILRGGFELYAKRMTLHNMCGDWVVGMEREIDAAESYLTGLFVAYTDCGLLNFAGDAVEFRDAIREIVENWINARNVF